MKRMLIVDAVALVAYAAASFPAFTGVDLHEWLGLAALAAVLAHCVLQVDAVVLAARRLGRGLAPARALRLALDAALVVAFAAVIVSGLGVSGAVLPTFGLYAEGYYSWSPLHAVAAKMLLALLLVHVAVQAPALYNLLKRKRGKGAAPDDGGMCDGSDERRSA